MPDFRLGDYWNQAGQYLGQASQLAKGLPSTVETGLQWLAQQTNPLEQLRRTGVTFEKVPGSPLPNFSLGRPSGLPAPPPKNEYKPLSAPPRAPRTEEPPLDYETLMHHPMVQALDDMVPQLPTRMTGFDQALPVPQQEEEPSPSPREISSPVKVKGQGFDWSKLQPALGVLGKMGHQLSRPGADRPYAQMGWDKQALEEQDQENLLRREALASRAHEQDIEARYGLARMEDQSARERFQQEMQLKRELLQEELKYKGDPNAPVSPEIAQMMGIPQGTTLREANLYADFQAKKSEADARNALQTHYSQMDTDRAADNKRAALTTTITALQKDPMLMVDPQKQAELKFYVDQLLALEGQSRFTPPPSLQAPEGQPQGTPPTESQGGGGSFPDWYLGHLGLGGLFGGGEEQPPQEAQPPGHPMVAAPQPVPPEHLQGFEKLPEEARKIVYGIFAMHGGDPVTLREKLDQFLREAPPQYKQRVMEVVGPILARSNY